MKRRQFVGRAAAGAALAGTLAACSREQAETTKPQTAASGGETRRWKMITAWPKGYPGLGTGPDYLARIVEQMSGGRLVIKVYGAGELVPALECFDAVQNGVAEMGHAASYYWRGKNPAFNFFASVPYGMNALEMNAWLYKGGGLELWEEAYAPFGLIPMAAGNSGMQMAGWFNREINAMDDLKGLKMRIPGLGGEVLRKAGGIVVNLPGGELFTAMQTGTIDAVEWTNPYNDLAFGLYKVGKYYYYPGWHEPGTNIECFIRRDAFMALPEDLQAIVRHACEAVHQDMLVEYTAHNYDALHALVEKHGVELRRLPDDVLTRFRELSEEVVQQVAAANDLSRRTYESYRNFMQKVTAWHKVSEQAYYDLRQA